MIQKKKMLISYVDSNVDIIQDMSKYQCLNRASPENQFLTTRLQYRTLKYLCAICSILLKLFRKHSLPTNYKIMYTGEPLNCYQRSDLFTELTKKIVKHSYILGKHFMKIDSDDLRWKEEFDETIYLMHKVNHSLWNYVLNYHLQKCKDLCYCTFVE